MPSGCPIGPLPCEYPPYGEPTCDFVPFEPQFPKSGCESSGYYLVMSHSTSQCVPNLTDTVIDLDTTCLSSGFTTAGATACVTIPRSGLWLVHGKVKYSCGLDLDASEFVYLQLIKGVGQVGTTVCEQMLINGQTDDCQPLNISALRFYDRNDVLTLQTSHTVGVTAKIGCNSIDNYKSRFSLFLLKASC